MGNEKETTTREARIRVIKMRVFEKIGSLGIDAMKRYVEFIIDAPEEDWELRMKVALNYIPGQAVTQELEDIISFLK